VYGGLAEEEEEEEKSRGCRVDVVVKREVVVEGSRV
jgi:hypothetical protein